MTEKGLKYLHDILHAIRLIEQFTSNISNYNEYLDDEKTQSAVERQLGIIGEAVNKFDAIDSGTVLSHSRKIVGLRNRLIHAYDAVDPTVIWTILKRYLTPLKEEINQIISSSE